MMTDGIIEKIWFPGTAKQSITLNHSGGVPSISNMIQSGFGSDSLTTIYYGGSKADWQNAFGTSTNLTDDLQATESRKVNVICLDGTIIYSRE